MRKIYYAHHIWKYRTEIEDYELGLIRSVFPDDRIINPMKFEHEDLSNEKAIMEKCIEELSQCDILVFSSLSGVVGAGVYEEVNYALEHNILVYYIINNGLRVIPNIFWNLTGKSRRVYAIVKEDGVS